MKARWENEKKSILSVQKLKEELNEAHAEIERLEQQYDLDKIAEIKYGKIPQLKKQIEEAEAKIQK